MKPEDALLSLLYAETMTGIDSERKIFLKYGDWGLGTGDWIKGRGRGRGHLALTLASPLGEEGHAVAKGCSTVRGVSDRDWG